MSDILIHDGWRLVREAALTEVCCFRLEYRRGDAWCHITLPYRSLAEAMDRDRGSVRPWLASEIVRHLDEAGHREAERRLDLEYARMC